MNKICGVQMFMCFILMSWMPSNCTPHFVAQVISSIWSYLSQFLTVLDEPRAKFKEISKEIRWNKLRDQ